MSRVRTEGTEPEMELRRGLHRRGLRFRVQYRVKGMGRRTVDIAFTRLRLAVLCDGCFWHSCPAHASWPRHNAEWWRTKLADNVERDRDTDRRLAALGWQVLRLWEHQAADEMVRAVAAAYAERSAQLAAARVLGRA